MSTRAAAQSASSRPAEIDQGKLWRYNSPIDRPAPHGAFSISNRGALALLVLVTSTSLAVALRFGLPSLAALAVPPPQAPAWTWLAPLLAALACALLLGRALGRAGGGTKNPRTLADLPARLFLVFLLVGLGTMFIGEAVSPWAELADRPTILVLAAPSLVLAHALVLRFLAQVPLVAEMERRLLDCQPGSAPGRPRGKRGISSLRRSLVVATLASSAASLGVIVAHAESRARREREMLDEAHLRNLFQVVAAQIQHLDSQALSAFLSGYPVSSAGYPFLTDANDRVLLPAESAGSRLLGQGKSCRLRGRTHRCYGESIGADRKLFVLELGAPHGEALFRDLQLDLLLLCPCILALAGLLGWAIGRDTSQDFRAIAQQLEAMAGQDEPDLGNPITVTSIDEVGDLTAALGRLREHLQGELAGYRESLRKTQEADQLRNRFFSDVSHALRTPLTTICGSAQLLAEGLLGQLSAAQQQDLRVIHGSAQHLLSLVSDIIDLSIIESGHLSLHLEKVNVIEICGELLQEQQAHARRREQETGKPLRLELIAQPELPAVLGDPLRLRQILQNLIANAVNHTNAGSVTVRVERQGDDALRIAVQDTGEGISANDIPHIFDRYRRAGPRRAGRTGTGLGLGIAKQLVGLHRGEITVHSEIGQGSTFTVVLPLRGPDGSVVGAAA